jgi:hypothetical protein
VPLATHNFLEINPRGEAAPAYCSIPQISVILSEAQKYACHPERSAAKSKDLLLFLLLFFAALKGRGLSRAAKFYKRRETGVLTPV